MVGRIATRELAVPEERTERRRMPSRLNLDQLVNSICAGSNAGGSGPHPVFGGVKEQIERHPFVLTAHKLEQRRIQTWNGNLGNLHTLIERELRGIKLD